MENVAVSTNEGGVNKTLIIIVLVFLLFFSFLGINILNILGNLIQSFINIIGPLVRKLLSVFGYTTGVIIDKSTDVITSTAKTGIDIAGGALDSISGLLIDASQYNGDLNLMPELNKSLHGGYAYNSGQVRSDCTTNPIQNPISSGKSSWCLVGEYQGKRGCIEVADQSKCLSGQIFPSQQMCMNPSMFSDNHHPLNSVKE